MHARQIWDKIYFNDLFLLKDQQKKGLWACAVVKEQQGPQLQITGEVMSSEHPNIPCTKTGYYPGFFLTQLGVASGLSSFVLEGVSISFLHLFLHPFLILQPLVSTGTSWCGPAVRGFLGRCRQVRPSQKYLEMSSLSNQGVVGVNILSIASCPLLQEGSHINGSGR